MLTKSSPSRARPFAWALLLYGSLTLAACGHGNSTQPQAVLAKAGPATPATLKLYSTTCQTCHSRPASGAPQLGDSVAWAPRLAQGKDALLDHVVNGYKSMPPMGMCMQCNEDDFTALVEYMSGSKLQ
ncbi:MAG: c-type cytochrome [Stenotrophobium sp.]